MNEFNAQDMYGDVVILRNTSTHNYVDMTPENAKIRIKHGEEEVVPRSLAKWLIGDWENAFYPTAAEVKVIYERNKYTQTLCVAQEIKKELSETQVKSWQSWRKKDVEDLYDKVKMIAQKETDRLKIEIPDTQVHDPERVRG